MRKILVTGASGFFGQALLKSLLKTDYDFECLAIYNTKKPDLVDRRITWFQVNLLDKENTQEFLRKLKPTHCVHLAWHVPPQKFWTATENIDWLHASINLFQAFCQNEGQVFLGAGSFAEYDWTSGVLDEIETPLEPATLYGQCKKSLHDIIKKVRDAYYSDVTILWPRIGYFFGPGEPKEKLIPMLMENIRGQKETNLALPEFSRPYTHIKYWGEVITKLLFSDIKGDLAFNMSAKKNYKLKEIVQFIQNKCPDNSSEINYGAYPSTPISLFVKTNPIVEIPDTFFDDLEKTWKDCNAKNR